MTIGQFLERALLIPHASGGAAWSGADCWGIVELYYRHILGIELNEREGIIPGHVGLQQGFKQAVRWVEVDAPEEGDLVIMRAFGLTAGHVGVFVEGHVLHSTRRAGCVFQPMSDPAIQAGITGFWSYQ